jgi:hypothetical protein
MFMPDLGSTPNPATALILAENAKSWLLMQYAIWPLLQPVEVGVMLVYSQDTVWAYYLLRKNSSHGKNKTAVPKSPCLSPPQFAVFARKAFPCRRLGRALLSGFAGNGTCEIRRISNPSFRAFLTPDGALSGRQF